MGHRLGETHAAAQERGSEQVDADVAVSELKPGLLAEAAKHRLSVKRVVAHTESRRVVEDAGEPVEDRIDVGAHQQTPELLVVGGVDDDREVRGRQHGGESGRQPGSPGPSGEQRHSHRKRSSSDGRTSS